MKIFYAFICLMLSFASAHSQCTPDTNITHNQPGTYPDTITGLPHSLVGQAYSTVIQVKVLTDSTIGTLTGVVDSIVITNVTGLPSGFNYACSPAGCSFPGGGNGCILLTGTAPTLAMVGTYPLTVQSTIYYKLFGVPQMLGNNISGYYIVIDTSTGIGVVDRLSFSAGQNEPNPSRDFTTIPVTVSHAEEITFTLSNVIGKKLFSHTYNLQRGKTNIPVDLHGLQPGIYLYTFTNGINTVTRRMIVSND